MKAGDEFLAAILDLDELPGGTSVAPANPRLWRAGSPTDVASVNGDVILDVPFTGQMQGPQVAPDPTLPKRSHRCRVRAYGSSAVRITIDFSGAGFPEESPMLELSSFMRPQPLEVDRRGTAWEARDATGLARLRVSLEQALLHQWSNLIPASPEGFAVTVLPEGKTEVPFMALDQFTPAKVDSLPLGYVGVGAGQAACRSTFALHAQAGEHYAGTGERFARMDLAGRTLLLENTDALGVNSRRAYKNVPLLLSSRPYGLFIHTSSRLQLSIADLSTRAVQALVDEPCIDFFLVGGPDFERILAAYRGLTGFPAEPPRWSYGTWMSRMTYFSAEEVRSVCARLRQEDLPCDVIHLDTGWFEKDWICEWKFSRERFPDPQGFMKDLRAQGFRVSLWQNPQIGPGNSLLPLAKEKGYLPRLRRRAGASGSDLSASEPGSRIDFTNPAAVQWYQGLLAELFRMGAAAIKTDFGENIDMDAEYFGMSAGRLRNLYALLYQKAAFEATARAVEHPLIWARAAWAGCQRYPVHWGGDAASTWDGMAASLRGGLHFGLSGFGFWSHDVPGFHGVPDFMNSRPSSTLYVRWTQFGVLSSHLRYHGASAREPWEYPDVLEIVRGWLRLRYALIPYLMRCGAETVTGGAPVLRALVFHDLADPVCWHVDDQFLCGPSLLAAPVMNDSGTRDIYLPAGDWVDFWTGQRFQGPRWIRAVTSPLHRMPLFAVRGSRIPVYPIRVACTDEMDPSRTVELTFDHGYGGMGASLLGPLTGLS